MNINITKREMQILDLISREYSTKQIACQLFIAYETAHAHRKNLMRKLKAGNAAGLIRKAFELGLLKLPVLAWQYELNAMSTQESMATI